MKKRLITSALPYINGVKHLGNLVGSMLPADIYARYSRQNNHTVLYICGTDEHGAPAEIAAHNEGVSVEEYCDKYHKIQKDIYQRFNLSFDYFGRTSSSSHHKFTKEVFESIISNGYIYQDEIEQYYSIDDQRYLPDRYIEGSCPECGFKSARGDQCDGCGCLLNPSELIEPYSALSGSKNLELRKTSHLFLDLKKLEGSLSQWLDKKTEWPELVRGISRKWLKEGLQSRCITRDLDWGIKVPLNDDTLKALYVWFDAPLGYISFTQEWAALQNSGDDWKSWWKEPGNVELVQFMAKDNVPFHTIFWPAMMMASTKNENENEWTLANYIKGVNWLTYEGGKFSTSQKIGVFTDKALELYPADYWRFALFSMMPEKSDSSFSFELFALAINKDLADSVGNFVSRLCKMIEKNFTEATIPAGFEVDQCLYEKLDSVSSELSRSLDDMEFRKTLTLYRKLWSIGNEYITETKPWSVIKQDREEGQHILKNCLLVLRVFAETLSCITPDISNAMRGVISQNECSFDQCLDINWLQSEVTINSLTSNLISKISDEDIERIKSDFGGQE